MAKISFTKANATGPSVSESKPKAKAAPVVEVEAEVGDAEDVKEETTKAVAVRESVTAEVGFVDEDNVGMDEIILPRLNIVQKVGPLSEEYTPGEIVLNKELVIYTPGKKDAKVTPLEITVLGFRPTQWTERIEGGTLGRLCDTPEEVAELGGTTNYQTWKDSTEGEGKEEIPYFQQLATCLVLIKRPEGVDEAGAYFPYEHGDDAYAIAQWSMKGAAYTNGAKVIKTARKIGHLRKGGYPSFSYLLDTKPKAFGTGNIAIIPVLRPGTRHPADFVAFAMGILGGDSESDKGTI